MTPSSGSDTDVSVPVTLTGSRSGRSDRTSSSPTRRMGRAAMPSKPRAGGTELVSPVAGSAPGNSHEGEGDGPPPLTAADFQIDVTGEQATVCPAVIARPSEEYFPEGLRRSVVDGLTLPGSTCRSPAPCDPVCPVKSGPACGGLRPQGGPGEALNIERRRRAELPPRSGSKSV